MEATITTDINTAYTQMRELIAKQAATFKRKYGGEFEELLSTANEAFIKQHRAFFAGKTAIKDDYQAAIRMSIWDAMLERTRRNMKRMEKAQMISINKIIEVLERMETREKSYDSYNACELRHGKGNSSIYETDIKRHTTDYHFTLLMDDLSEDAAQVARIVLDTPEVFGTRHITKEVVQRHMRTLGWQYKRIKATFNEIKTVLQEA
jgi:hypothetical protein